MKLPQAKFKEEKIVTDGGYYISCLPSGAGLKPALSAVQFSGGVPQNISGAFFSKSINTHFLFAEGGLYFTRNNKVFVRIASSPAYVFGFEFIYEDKPCAGIYTGNGVLRYTTEKFSSVPFGTQLCAGAMHCGRLFAIDRQDNNKLLWSAAGDFTDWSHDLDKAGYLMLDPERGKALNILCFNGRLVLVREYGLTVINMFGSPENYATGITDTSCEKIYKDTAVVADGKLLFFTQTGLCSFDGSRITRLEHRNARDITNGFCAVEFAGNYILACESEALQRKVLLCYRIADGESYIIDCEAEALSASDAVYVYCNGNVKRLEEGNFEYTAERLDFGTHKNKTLTEITFKGGANMEVACGDKTRVYAGADGIVRPRMRGKNFAVKITGNTAVENIVAKAEVSVGI